MPSDLFYLRHESEMFQEHRSTFGGEKSFAYTYDSFLEHFKNISPCISHHGPLEVMTYNLMSDCTRITRTVPQFI